MGRTTRRLPALVALAAVPTLAQAVLIDEIQVYDDAIDKPGEYGLELHVNATPRGRGVPDYPGEVVPNHGLRLTPEFSRGLTESLEAGLYIPLAWNSSGTAWLPGVKLRMKWLPQRPAEGRAGAFYGVNVELSRVKRRFEASTNAMELRPIIGYRDPDWLLVANPVLGYDLSPDYRRGGFDFSPGVKASRRVAEGIAGGFEYYAELGKLAHQLPGSEQTHTLFAVIDVDRAPWVFNLGIGRGLNAATDRWTVKAIFEIPLH